MAKNDKIDELYGQLREADSLAQKGDKQAAADAQKIYNYIQSLSGEEFVPTPPLLGGIAGAGAEASVAAGVGLPYALFKGIKKHGATQAENQLLKQFAALPPEVQAQIKLQNVDPTKWTKAVTGADFAGSSMTGQSEKTAEALKNIVGRGGPMAGGSLTQAGIAIPPKTVQEIKAAEEAKIAAQAAEKAKLSNRLLEGGKQVMGKVGSTYAPVAKVLGPLAGGFGAGYAGTEAYNRYNQGDTTGSVLHGLEGVASAASMYPPFAPVAVPTALGLAGINAYRDKLRRGNIEHGSAQQNVDASGNAYATGGLVHLAEGQSTGKSDSPSGMQAGLQYLEELLRAIKNPEKTPVVPVPNRWFSQPDKFPQVQGLVEKALTHSGQPREAFHSGAFIDPRTGEVLDRRIYNNLGVVIDPKTGKPMMSVGNQAGIEVLDPKTGSYTKSNLVRKNLFTPTGGDPLLNRLPFIATIENKGVHHYGLGTQYATPTELHNTMKGENPTLRPRSRGEVFGMGDVVGQARIGGRGEPKNIYEKLFVAPKGSDVPGVRLGTTGGGGGGYINPINPLMGSGLTPFGMKTGGKVKK
jgi:hypothetical protein